jgi:hypothetical protein
VLEKVGFHVRFFLAIPHPDKVLSNKESMLQIYDIVAKGEDEWVYVFEDDINLLADIRLDEIVEYEAISSMFVYLGLCVYSPKISHLSTRIQDHPVTVVQGGVRGLHAIGLSKKGAAELGAFARRSSERYMDVCLEKFSIQYPANVVRYDLQSYISGHRGVFFQDRKRFLSSIP